jgi:hypothetical protein
MIICHIVGICNKLKVNFINDVKNISNIFIIDIDDISKKIIFSEEYNLLNKSKMPNNITKLGYYWKEKIRSFLVYIPNQSNMMYTSIAWHEWLGMAWGQLRGIL